MDSRQMDVIQALLADADDFVHAFDQQFPKKTAELEAFMQSLAEWADSNPTPEQ